VGTGHSHPLHRPGDSPVHRLPAEVKLLAAFLGVVCVVITPREAFGVFGGHLLLLGVIWAVARIPPGWMAVRALIEAPFVVLAVLLPFTGPDPRVDLLGLSLSEEGLLGAWNILIKGTLGVLTSLTLAATTPLRDLLLGLQRLRAPALVVTIVTLMLRYVDVIAGEARGSPAATTPGSSGRPAPPRAPWGRCSSAPTSAGSGCTWRCCPAAGAARCRRCPRRAPRAGSGPPAWPPSPWRPRSRSPVW